MDLYDEEFQQAAITRCQEFATEYGVPLGPVYKLYRDLFALQSELVFQPMLDIMYPKGGDDVHACYIP